MAKIIGKIVKRIARIFWAISNKLFFISAKLLKEKIACYETKTYDFQETTELVIEWERGEDGRSRKVVRQEEERAIYGKI